MDQECFVISGIGARDSVIRNRADRVQNLLLLDPCTHLGLIPLRADQISEVGSIDDQIIEHVLGARMCIADLTGLNPNVMYELAVRHSFGKPVVTIAAEGTQLPFDTASSRTLFYDLDSSDRIIEANRELIKLLRSALDEVRPRNLVVNRVERTSLEASQDAFPRSLARLEDKLDLALGILGNEDQSLRDARFFYNNSDYEEALNKYEDCLDRIPDSRDAKVGKARTLRMLGQTRGAIRTLDEVIEQSPSDGQALYNRACGKAVANYDHDAVQADLERAISIAERYRRYARNDPDFESVRDASWFVQIVELPD